MERQKGVESRTQVKRSADQGRPTEMGVNKPRKGVAIPIFRKRDRKLEKFLTPALSFLLRL